MRGRGHGPAPTKTMWLVGAHPCVRPPTIRIITNNLQYTSIR